MDDLNKGEEKRHQNLVRLRDPKKVDGKLVPQEPEPVDSSQAPGYRSRPLSKRLQRFRESNAKILGLVDLNQEEEGETVPDEK